MKFILGKKIEMSQIFNENGDVVPVTLVHAGPCKITQVKNMDKDSYTSVQIGFDKKKKLSKAVRGHLKGLKDYKWLREFRIDSKELMTEQGGSPTSRREANNLKRGDKIRVDCFEVGDKVKITGVSKGKGFQGVVKRHGFHGSPASHGHKDQLRMPGSIGATEPARVFKGKKMPGQMGNAQVTVKNLEIAKIDNEKNILYLKGAVPGARGSLVMISGEGELRVNVKKDEETRNKKLETRDANKKEDKDEKEKKEEIEEKK